VELTGTPQNKGMKLTKRDARLIGGENDRPIVKRDGDARDPSRVDSPGLLTHQCRPQLPAARFGDSKAE
jgi:hypothetical protein